MDIHWRNISGSGLLEHLARRFERITVVGPRSVSDKLPANVESIKDIWLFSDPLIHWLSHVIRFHFQIRYPKLNQYRKQEWRKLYPAYYWLAFFLGYPIRAIFFIGVFLRALIAMPRMRGRSPDVILANSFIWESYDSVLRIVSLLNGIPWISMITSWDNPGTKGRFMTHPGNVLVWGELNRRQTIHFQDIEPNKAVALTPPHFFRMRFARTDATKPKHVLYVGGTKNNYDFEVEFVEDLYRLLTESGLIARHPLLLRPHPNNHEQWEKRFRGRSGILLDGAIEKRTSQWTVFGTDQNELDAYYSTLKSSLVTISHYSTATVEAGLLGVPTIITKIVYPQEDRNHQWLTDHFEHWNQLRHSPGIQFVFNQEELKSALLRAERGWGDVELKEHLRMCEDVARFPTEDLFEQYAKVLNELR